ncbi:MAG: type VI secretion system baseplate subunit TssK [Iodobacter sp.]
MQIKTVIITENLTDYLCILSQILSFRTKLPFALLYFHEIAYFILNCPRDISVKIFKPAWQEGVLLSPQHFQQESYWNKFDNQQIKEMVLAFPWGIKQFILEEKALQSDRLQAQSVSLQFTDGSVVDSQVCDVLPPGRDLADVPVTQQSVVVFLALPLFDSEGDNYQAEGAASPRPRRFFSEFHEVSDLYGGSPNELSVERQALRFLFDFEEAGDFVACPVLRLIRHPHGGFGVDREFIPPCLTLAAAPRLQEQTALLCDILLAKSDRLMARRSERVAEVADFSVGDISLFWLLNSINSHWPALTFLRQWPGCHPEQLYRELASLAGALVTFSTEYRLADIPAYSHAVPGPVFSKLDELIRNVLDTVIPSRVVIIELAQISATQWSGHLRDPRLIDGAEYYLSVQASVPAHLLQEQFPFLCKAGSPDDVAQIINSALNGVPLKPMTRVPSAIPLRLENQYFALDSQSEAFRRMMQAQSCSFYAPASLAGLSLELFAVLPV